MDSQLAAISACRWPERYVFCDACQRVLELIPSPPSISSACALPEIIRPLSETLLCGGCRKIPKSDHTSERDDTDDKQRHWSSMDDSVIIMEEYGSLSCSQSEDDKHVGSSTSCWSDTSGGGATDDASQLLLPGSDPHDLRSHGSLIDFRDKPDFTVEPCSDSAMHAGRDPQRIEDKDQYSSNRCCMIGSNAPPSSTWGDPRSFSDSSDVIGDDAGSNTRSDRTGRIIEQFGSSVNYTDTYHFFSSPASPCSDYSSTCTASGESIRGDGSGAGSGELGHDELQDEGRHNAEVGGPGSCQGVKHESGLGFRKPSSALEYDEYGALEWRLPYNSSEVLQQQYNTGARGPKIVKHYSSLVKRSVLRAFVGGRGRGDDEVGGHSCGRGEVYVNGQLIPESAVVRAEEKAGSIHPGSYWYDYKAGFWGVMGGPCQGILMPHIEELMLPMEKDCASGQTSIYVNGRELHEEDLEILAKRGLPRTLGMAYSVDIQGNVWDKASGLRLKSLGKLAPTVEKRGRGFGMSPSRLQR